MSYHDDQVRQMLGILADEAREANRLRRLELKYRFFVDRGAPPPPALLAEMETL